MARNPRFAGQIGMIEVFDNLFVGSQQDESSVRGQSDWYFIHACKEPYHRQALGYTGRGAPKNHPEYLIAVREERLILNLVDADDVAYIPAEIIDAALTAINQNIVRSRVLVHCNQGFSRSPAVALLYMARFTDRFRAMDHGTAVQQFRRIYPTYAPAAGIAKYVRLHWSKYAAPDLKEASQAGGAAVVSQS
jgi:hypothetical protein